MKKPQRILVTRTDRLGDVLMSLHALACVRQQLPGVEVDFLIRPDLPPVFQGLASQWKIGLKSWTAGVELGGYDGALCLFDDPTLLSALKKNRIPTRVGNYSKLRSFFSLTHGLRQRRGLGKKSEAEYNLELARLFLGIFGETPSYSPTPLTLPVQAEGAQEARRALKKIGVDLGERYWCAHPGMGGSALNLGAPGYVALLDSLAAKQTGPLVLTLGPAAADLHLVEAIVEERPQWRVLPRVPLPGLAEVFRGADLVVAPSTGPLHLAHYVGAKTLGIYSPVQSHHPRRWAPWGGSGTSFVLSPDHPCPGKKNCLGRRCKRFYCLDKLPAKPLPAGL